ncbi:MAG: pantoate--beta-alanine ligase [Candidatus Dormibacteria bacterium]
MPESSVTLGGEIPVQPEGPGPLGDGPADLLAGRRSAEVADESLSGLAPDELARRAGIRLVRRRDEMRRLGRRWLAAGESVGFVPTMGALHRAHLTLVERARAENRHVVVSIFVNPTQFTAGEDFTFYPRRLASDLEALRGTGVEVVFAPSADEMYPDGHATRVQVERLSDVVEGSARPGHFEGVATVVTALLGVVRPDRAYFGRKDAQQLAVVRRLVEDLGLDAEVIACPTVREPDGLALSSRNEYLDERERAAATCLWRGLWAARNLFIAGERSAARLRRAVESEVEQESLADLEYTQVVMPDTFDVIAEARPGALVVVAARVGRTRLIDNLELDLGQGEDR